MPVYAWKGIRGNQYLTGTMEALNHDEAAFKVKQQGIIITALVLGEGQEEARREKKALPQMLRRKKIPPREVLVFTRKTATMMHAGLPILQAFEMLREQAEHPYFREILGKVYMDVEAGTRLSDSFAKYPEVFDVIYINLVRAGEASGRLDFFLSKLVTNMERALRLRAAVKSALTYPVILLVVATGVVAVMMIWVVPVFAQMYGESGQTLPTPTQIVMNISDFLRNPLGGGALLLGLLGAALGVRAVLKKNAALRRKWHRRILKLPVMGEIILKSALAKIAMVQGNLSAAGVPVIESLDIAASSTTNMVLREAFEAVKRGVFSGEPLSTLLRQQPIVPVTYADLVAVGERTGNMKDMLEAISRYYEEEFDDAVGRLSAMLEPIMIVFLGVTIGFILVAMYLPIFKMGQTMV